MGKKKVATQRMSLADFIASDIPSKVGSSWAEDSDDLEDFRAEANLAYERESYREDRADSRKPAETRERGPAEPSRALAANNWRTERATPEAAPPRREFARREESSFDRRRDDSRDFDRRRDYDEDRSYDRPRREEREHKEFVIPSNPPFTAYIGNLSYDVRKDDIYEFFRDCEVESVRLVTDNETGRLKGFGYVEFKSADGLRRALDQNGRDFLGRAIKLDVAEQQPQRGGDRPQRSGGFFRDRDSRQESSRAFDSDWRDKSIGPQPTFREERPRRDDRPSRGFEDRPRGGFDDFRRSESRDRDEPKERPRLSLAPRTETAASDKPAEPAEAAKPAKPKINPFGAAKPRDENEAMRRIEEARKAREEEARKKEEAQRSEEKTERRDDSRDRRDDRDRDRDDRRFERRDRYDRRDDRRDDNRDRSRDDRDSAFRRRDDRDRDWGRRDDSRDRKGDYSSFNSKRRDRGDRDRRDDRNRDYDRRDDSRDRRDRDRDYRSDRDRRDYDRRDDRDSRRDAAPAPADKKKEEKKEEKKIVNQFAALSTEDNE
eukprot:GEZU01035835.1.p1 GENE.GEZU01035835.1~~GEZU01035835.1.p1  ORF type:complete len:547 (+),score=173.75 GEZU01035835.1:78-1718(+)